MDHATKTDDFLENFQTACPACMYAEKALFKVQHSAIQFLGLEMAPPPSGTFLKIHQFWS